LRTHIARLSMLKVLPAKDRVSKSAFMSNADKHGRFKRDAASIGDALGRRIPYRKLPLDHVGDFGNQRAILKIPAERVPVLVIDKEKIAERAVDDVESNIRTPLPGVAVVLNQGI